MPKKPIAGVNRYILALLSILKLIFSQLAKEGNMPNNFPFDSLR